MLSSENISPHVVVVLHCRRSDGVEDLAHSSLLEEEMRIPEEKFPNEYCKAEGPVSSVVTPDRDSSGACLKNDKECHESHESFRTIHHVPANGKSQACAGATCLVIITPEVEAWTSKAINECECMLPRHLHAFRESAKTAALYNNGAVPHEQRRVSPQIVPKYASVVFLQSGIPSSEII